MRQEAEVYKQQLELERLRQELISLRGHPNKPLLPQIGMQGYPRNISPIHENKEPVSSFSTRYLCQRQSFKGMILHPFFSKFVGLS